MLIVPYTLPQNEHWATIFTALEAHAINQVSWTDYPYAPKVEFKIVHDAHFVYLEYQVNEQELKARYQRTNDPVYKDSCVEFFLSFSPMDYYNLEFNSLGTALMSYGPADKASRHRLDPQQIEQIECIKSFDTVPDKAGNIRWSLRLKIPKTIFKYHQQEDWYRDTLTANFYKCGDDLQEPHFVSWKKIEIEEPDFHQPEFFGKIRFEKGSKAEKTYF